MNALSGIRTILCPDISPLMRCAQADNSQLTVFLGTDNFPLIIFQR